MTDEIPAELRAEYAAAEQRLAAARAAQPSPRPIAEVLAAIATSAPMRDPAAAEREQRAIAARDERIAKRDAAAARAASLAAITSIPVRRDLLEPILDGAVSATPAITAVREWYDARSKPVLVLIGGVGSGKTVAAACLVVHARASSRHLVTAYAKMRDVANLYRAGFGADAAAFERLIVAGLLVIDELTTERDIDLGRAALHEVIDERGAHGRPTLLLANRTKDEIRSRYDARTIDRLRENAAVVELAATSMRKGAW